MRRDYFLDIFSGGFYHTWKQQFWAGILFILTAIAIIVIPQLLVAIVASFLLMAGIVVLRFAWAARRLGRQYPMAEDVKMYFDIPFIIEEFPPVNSTYYPLY